ncbi:ATP-dependent RNA helicase, putative [Plasmodium knowlesi strain H]|uniref:ATP-dependent RNA helicase n=3 Tax=Plasmodium knowlesi TaxID=5850 RepID=A0A5K1VQG0_PLAKH|nr:ATP-dependent rRNA helicase SPB4, putative [Plasmodium knowlesi strain H]OTN67794.1 putative ATP-dependent RNA helicase [Plasmodium knowlesi]CAA9990419.1 ATP-dependent rRNA helicase SPB4, putative [Plasmodium knowlesi strain H]SBO19625.1 ATP-dependent RNA helicase, putative [Plasmodium knowlesi strain H]SBO22582.1 ATP-dependent RNA helicase, putative [Plasmodium knowlesi strain H]VVS79893.1 ATP-dependent rRNA helicase SPB4, putative [Plasmodium knowlesi strain H]|eukprot:XP_002260819.1 ATP-dependent RNA helicase, putative [Plasmodium knowlesi strain H]
MSENEGKQPIGATSLLRELELTKKRSQKTPFTQLNLDESILFSLLIQRYLFCANIQEKAIPLIGKKENVLLHSETGSGKTLCFVIPMLENLVKSKLGALRREFLFKSTCEEAKEEEEQDDCYDEERVNCIYNKFENVNIEKSIPPVDINVAKFIQYIRTSLEDTPYKKDAAVGNGGRRVNKDDPHPPRGKNMHCESIEGVVKRCIRCTMTENKSKQNIHVNGVIIAPTRELCIQIFDVVNKFLFFIRLYFAKIFNIHVDELDKEVFFVNSLLFRGAVKIEEDLKIIKNEKKKKNRSQIIVATPGKLSTLFVDHKCHFDTSELAYLILDEGDKLLEESFLNYVQDVVKSIASKDYATCICSATCLQEEKFYNLFSDKRRSFIKCVGGPSPIASTTSALGTDATASTTPAGTGSTPGNTFQMPEKIENYYITVRNLDKSFFLFKFLSTVVREGETVIVFLPTCFCVDFFFHVFKNVLNTDQRTPKEIFNHIVTLNNKHKNVFSPSDLALFCKMIHYTQKYMGKKKFILLKIHRKMKDKKRISAYKKIKENKNKRRIKIILCTDIMSRGINVDIHWVINYDVANKNMTYIHRSGRTGRFDKTGKNIILLNKKEKEYIYFLKNKKVNISNFRKTSMFSDMLSWESRVMRNEDALDTQVREVANMEKGKMGKSFHEKNFSFYGNMQRKRVQRREVKGGDVEGHPPKRDDHILLLNNMVNIFLKYIIFFIIENRETYLLSTKAFLSYIEFYKNHQLSFLFPFHKLNLGHLCHSFALVKIPKFKEKGQIKNFKRVGLNTSDIPYKNEEKERKRQEELTRLEQLRSEEHAANEKAESQTNMEGGKANKRKQEKKQKKRKTIVQRKHEQRDMEENEIESLFFEENLYKKLKKKKISKDEYDRLLNMENLDKIFSTPPSGGKNQTVAPRKNQAAASNRKRSKKKRKVYNMKVKKRRKGGGKRR